VVERHPVERERLVGLGGQLIPADRVRRSRGTVQIGQFTTWRRDGSALRMSATSAGAVDVLVAVPVPVHGDQQRRLDLLPAVHHRAGAELGRARGEHGAQARVASMSTNVSGMFGA
jgi:hypothetical protein